MTLLLQAAALIAAALALAALARRVGLPPLLGMIAGGVAVRALLPGAPGAPDLDAVAPPIRLAILAVVLLRAGLGLSRDDLRAAGALAIRLGLLPLAGDALLVAIAGAWLLGLPAAPAAVLGCTVAAISPAIVIPGMIDLLRDRVGSSRRVPTALLAAAPIDNLVAVVGLGVAIDLATAGEVHGTRALASVPLSIAGGALAGGLAGLALGRATRRWPTGIGLRGAALAWALAVGLVVTGEQLGISFVVAILALGFATRVVDPHAAEALSGTLRRVWEVVQVGLFGLIGWAVDLGPLAAAGLALAAVVVAGQLGRAAGSWVATAGSGLGPRARVACILGFVPKATIQAAFAALPLDRGLADGETILAAGALAIVLTAPIGVVLVGRLGEVLDGSTAVTTPRGRGG